MHPQRLSVLYIASNSWKRHWDCKLHCIQTQIELSSSFIYVQHFLFMLFRLSHFKTDAYVQRPTEVDKDVRSSGASKVYKRCKVPVGRGEYSTNFYAVRVRFKVQPRIYHFSQSYNCYHVSDVWCYMLCYITVIRRLMSDVWCLISHVW